MKARTTGRANIEAVGTIIVIIINTMADMPAEHSS